MCGILGFTGDFPADALARGMAAMAHRGPDDSGVFNDQAAGVALGHVRLAIIDLSAAGHQPMVSDDEAAVLVFNGEIYNFRELRSELEARGTRFRGHSDTEVLLNLYLALGPAMLARLNGIFAFAIYDRRRGELLLARDALGVKPLYYLQRPGLFAFASEIKGLLPVLRTPPTLDAVALHRYLTFLWCPGDGTPLIEVRRLPPGQALRVRAGRMAECWSWYRLPQTRPSAWRGGPDAAVAAVRDGLRTAVRRQLVADVPVGAFLSGGLDSSAVVAFARESVPDLCCFTIAQSGGGDEGVTDDLPFARRVAAHLGVRLEVVSVDARSLVDGLEQMVWHLDEPLADPAPLNLMYICRLARDNGIKVLLSGAGGDDLFTGYRRHLAIRLEGLWSWLPAGSRRWLDRQAGALGQRHVLGRRLGRLFLDAGESGDRRLAAYFAWARREDLMPLYSARLRAAIADARADQPMLDFLAATTARPHRLDRMLALEQRFFLGDHNLIYTDKMSMAVGVEVRVPFLDCDLVELAGALPERLKQRGRTGKWVLKKALEPDLPHDVIHRPKTGFGLPLRRWIRNELRPLLGDLLTESSLRQRGLFDPPAVQALIAANDQGRRDTAYTLLSLMCIEIWCRRFIDAPAAATGAPSRQSVLAAGPLPTVVDQVRTPWLGTA